MNSTKNPSRYHLQRAICALCTSWESVEMYATPTEVRAAAFQENSNYPRNTKFQILDTKNLQTRQLAVGSRRAEFTTNWASL